MGSKAYGASLRGLVYVRASMCMREPVCVSGEPVCVCESQYVYLETQYVYLQSQYLAFAYLAASDQPQQRNIVKEIVSGLGQ